MVQANSAKQPTRSEFQKKSVESPDMSQRDEDVLDKFIQLIQEGKTQNLEQVGFKFDPETQGYEREWIDPEYKEEEDENDDLEDDEIPEDPNEPGIDEIMRDADDFLLRKKHGGRTRPEVRGVSNNFFTDPYYRQELSPQQQQKTISNQVEKKNNVGKRFNQPK